MKRIVVAGLTGMREFLFRSLYRMGVEVVVVDQVNSSYLRYADRGVPVADVRSYDQTLSALLTVCEEKTPAGFLSFYDYTLPAIAEAARRYGVPTLSPEAAQNAINKDRTRELLAEAGVGSPQFRAVQDVQEAVRAAAAIGYPVVIKPSNRAGSRSVMRANNEAEVRDAFADAWSSKIGPGVVMVEEFMDGPEVSVETVTFQGRSQVVAVCAKHDMDSNYFYETGHTMTAPSDWPQALTDTVIGALAALGVDNAVTHTEVKLTSRGPRIVEVNARVGGGLIPDGVFLSCGVNLYEVAAAIAMAKEPTVQPHWRQNASVGFLISGAGRLKKIAGLDQVHAIPGVLDVQVWAKPGDLLGPTRTNHDQRGVVMAVGPTREAADEAVRRAKECLQFVTEID